MKTSKPAVSHKAPVLPAKVQKAQPAAKPAVKPKPADAPPLSRTGPETAPEPPTIPVQPNGTAAIPGGVQEELSSLDSRIAHLNSQLSAPGAVVSSGILLRQREAMVAYRNVLDERLRTGELT